MFDAVLDQIAELTPPDMAKSVLNGGNCYSIYQGDPIGFGETVLNDTYTDDVKTLMQSVLQYPVTLAKSANGTGKTHCAARVAIWFYKTFPDAQVYTAAAPPESNLKRLLWGEIGGIVHKHKELFSDDRTLDLHISRSPQSFITGVTIPTTGTVTQREARFSGKHAPHLLFILDEGDAIPPEVYSGIESCMSGGWARLLVLFNPREEIGPVYQMERDGLANVVSLSAFNHPNVVTGDNIYPGAVDREKTVKRINLWSRPLAGEEKPDSECFQVPDFLVGSVATRDNGTPFPPLPAGWRKIEEPALSYMVLGQYPAQSSTQLISREWVNAARSRYDLYVSEHGEIPPKGVLPVQGLDVAEFGTDSNVLCNRYGGFVPPLVSWTGIDTIETGEKAAGHYRDKNAYAINIDGTGLGSSVAPQMQRLKCNALGVKMSEGATAKCELGEFGLVRDQMWWATREWLRTDPGSMLPPDEKLCEELTTPRYELKNGKIKVMDRDTIVELIKRSPDRATALCLTHIPALSEPLIHASKIDAIVMQAMGSKYKTGLLSYPTDREIETLPGVTKESILFRPREEGEWSLFDMPDCRKEYVLAVKTKGEEIDGEKNYFNVIQAFDRGKKDDEPLIQVAEYRSRTDIDLFADEVIKAYMAFFKPLVFPRVSRYDHGDTLINLIKYRVDVYSREVIDELSHKITSKLGWHSDDGTNRQIIDILVETIRAEKIDIKSPILASEIKAYGQVGSYSDLAITAALIIQANMRIRRKGDFKIINIRSAGARS